MADNCLDKHCLPDHYCRKLNWGYCRELQNPSRSAKNSENSNAREARVQFLLTFLRGALLIFLGGALLFFIKVHFRLSQKYTSIFDTIALLPFLKVHFYLSQEVHFCSSLKCTSAFHKMHSCLSYKCNTIFFRSALLSSTF